MWTIFIFTLGGGGATANSIPGFATKGMADTAAAFIQDDLTNKHIVSIVRVVQCS
jgi:hypothetical protein